ncbi:MAG: hypothetical protein ACR2PG_08535 [Hyphomicrobiaceae bacterium]
MTAGKSTILNAMATKGCFMSDVLADGWEAYQSWPPRALADPRRATETQLKAGFVEIVTAEGPVLALRVLQAYAKAGGVSRLTPSFRPKMIRTLQLLIDGGELIAVDEYGCAEEDPSRFVLRTPDQSTVRPRTLGDRSFDEIPPSEIAELALEIRIRHELIGEEELTRKVLSHYGLKRLTGLVKRHMDLVLTTYF